MWNLPWREYAEEFSSAKARMQQNSSALQAGVLLKISCHCYHGPIDKKMDFSQKIARDFLGR